MYCTRVISQCDDSLHGYCIVLSSYFDVLVGSLVVHCVLLQKFSNY